MNQGIKFRGCGAPSFHNEAYEILTLRCLIFNIYMVDVIQVELGFLLNQILHVDEKAQTIKTTTWTRLLSVYLEHVVLFIVIYA